MLQHLGAMRQRLLSAVELEQGGEREDGDGHRTSLYMAGPNMVSQVMVQVVVSKAIEQLKDERFEGAVATLSALSGNGSGSTALPDLDGVSSGNSLRAQHNNL